ncbi:ABC transporter permease subunit [Streptomyces reniochalinae]|uniref:ABC transporter permease n=1 Tax=Streptomyces reniochalinae TaxID=2250578 RepID=A0A367EG14_9ACTN|nr:ABC transporter permease subunit [Streptomyces reniochalinae]RCG17028.1 ABC transporter permease [Streptomyces reniochalinae]
MSPDRTPAHATPAHAPAPPGSAGSAPAGGGSRPGRGQDVIHNIGYRGYEGPRLGRSYARRALFSQTLRGAYGLGRSAKSKVLPMLLFAAVSVPAAIVVAVSVVAKSDDLPVGYSEYVLMMQPLIGIYLAAAAPQAFSLDLRFKTTPLYFSRPMERGDYVVAKFAALSAALFVFTAAPVLIMYAGALLAKLGFAEQSGAAAQGLVFCALFALLHAAIAAWIAALTPRRGFGIAAIIVAVTVPFFLITALQGIAWTSDSKEAVGWLGVASPGTLLDGIQSTFLGGSSQFPGGQDLTGAQGAVYLVVLAALLVCFYALLQRRYRKAGL